MADQTNAPISADILVVDDVPDNLRLISKLLRSHGFRVRVAASGQMALTAIATAPPHLVLLDIVMSPMDGYEVCQRLKANPATKDIPVIFISASDERIDKAKAFSLGGVDYISKPFQTDEVLMRISNQLTLFHQQQQLKRTEATYRSIFENATEGIFQVGVNGRYLSANPALAQIYGYSNPQELIASMTDISQQLYVRPGRRQELEVYLKEYGSISDAESEVYRKDGTQIWIAENIHVVHDDSGQFLYYEGTVRDITSRRHMEMELRQERLRAEHLLVNVLPFQIAQRLKSGHQGIADSYENVSVLFADLVDFTTVSAHISPRKLVTLLNQIFSTFDHLAEKHGLEKIKTIGDAYMVAAGIPEPRVDHATAIAQMALDMQQAIANHTRPDGSPFQLRIGINSGSVIAGVIGSKKFIYDLWGDTVNIASRMESTGEPGRIHVTQDIYNQLKHEFLFKPRGMTTVKGRGVMMTYWLLAEQ
ncbi:MAG: response regulator [Leptolyngbyaceae cyanobacterium SL_7_1]|nr:response regulator [Leptolyngbyaceae cyanobacterium SL_7_1]